jgi:transposase-like protein
MSTLSCRGFRFPWTVIQHAIWLYARFTLSLRDVEELPGPTHEIRRVNLDDLKG